MFSCCFDKEDAEAIYNSGRRRNSVVPTVELVTLVSENEKKDDGSSKSMNRSRSNSISSCSSTKRKQGGSMISSRWISESGDILKKYKETKDSESVYELDKNAFPNFFVRMIEILEKKESLEGNDALNSIYKEYLLELSFMKTGVVESMEQMKNVPNANNILNMLLLSMLKNGEGLIVIES
jgi:hypothetical protein